MITFLPYPDFDESARVLDRARLGKQRVEAWMILRSLCGETTGWNHHPAVKMWQGYEHTLCRYLLAMCREWQARGYVDNLAGQLLGLRLPATARGSNPPWLGSPDLHRSHRANLARKDPAYYVPKFGNLPPEPYVWPVNHHD